MNISKYDIAIVNERCLCIVKSIDEDGYTLSNLITTPRDENGSTKEGYLYKVTKMNKPDCCAYTICSIGIPENEDFQSAFEFAQDHFSKLMLSQKTKSLAFEKGAVYINECGIASTALNICCGTGKSYLGHYVQEGIMIEFGEMKKVEAEQYSSSNIKESTIIFYPLCSPEHSYDCIMNVLNRIKTNFLDWN